MPQILNYMAALSGKKNGIDFKEYFHYKILQS